MHNIDPKLKNIITNWLKENIYFTKLIESDYSKMIKITDNYDVEIMFYYPKNEYIVNYVYKGEYPMIYIENSKQLRDFISFFTTRHIPIIVEWLENEHNIKLPYEVLIWGDFRLLHRSLQKGIYGNLYVE